MSPGQIATSEETDLDSALKALASPHRREILRLLLAEADSGGISCCAPRDVCACKLAEHTGLALSTISHHMSVLRRAGLVSSRKDGTWVHYAADAKALDRIADAIRNL